MRVSAFRDIIFKDIPFPALRVADYALPGTASGGGESGVVFDRIHRFQAEDFNKSAGGPAEEKPRGHHLGVVEDHDRIFRKELRKIAENALGNGTVFIYEELRRIPFRKRILGNALVRKLVIEIFYMNYRNHYFVRIQNPRKDSNSYGNNVRFMDDGAERENMLRRVYFPR